MEMSIDWVKRDTTDKIFNYEPELYSCHRVNEPENTG